MGKLYTWGQSLSGRLGNGTTTPNVVSPAQIGLDQDWQVVSAIRGHGLAIKAGALYSWGTAANGRLGNGLTTPDVLTPTQVGTSTDWTDCSGGEDCSFAIRDGKLYSWGAASNGRLGNGLTTPDVLTPTQIGTDSNWNKVDASQDGGAQHCLAIKNNGELWSWGTNADGQLGDGTTTARTSPVRVGSDSDWSFIATGKGSSGKTSAAIKTNGKLYAWGAPSNYGLGHSVLTTFLAPQQVGTMTTWTCVALGSSHGAGIADGKLYTWGLNANYATAQGTNVGNTIGPTQVGIDADWAWVTAGTNYVLAIKTNGTLYSFGSDSGGQLGNGASTTDVQIPTQVGTNTDWYRISASRGLVAAAITSNPAPTNTAAPSLSGTFQTGQTVSTSNGTWSNSPTSYSYQWSRSATSSGTYTNISGATSSSYTIVSGDASYFLKCTVTATNTGGSTSASSDASTEVLDAPVNTTAPAITGSAEVGQTLSLSDGTWSGVPSPSYAYIWQKKLGAGLWETISGETSNSLLLDASLAGHLVRGQVTATNSVASVLATSNQTAEVTLEPVNQVLPAISTTDDVLQVGSTLTSTNGTWNAYPAIGSGFTYQWQKSNDGSTGWSNLADETSSSLLVPSSVGGKYVRLQVTASNGVGDPQTVNSAASAFIAEDPVSVIAPIIYGPSEWTPGQTLYVNPGTWTGFPNPDFTIWIQRSADGSTGWTTIHTGGTYEIQEADVDAYLRALVQGSNNAGEATAASAPQLIESPGGAVTAVIGALLNRSIAS